MQVQVARIGKPHGIRGEVTVQVLTDAPEERFVPGARFTVDPTAQGPLTVESARWNKDILLLAFEEVPDRNHAETLRGARLFVDTEEVEPEEDAWYESELEGLEVRVGGERIGTVRGLRPLSAQDLLIVEDTRGQEVLVPFVRQIVPEVNVAGGYVTLTPPPGLLDVNAPQSADAPAEDDAPAEGGVPGDNEAPAEGDER